jgi:hypothetical protein
MLLKYLTPKVLAVCAALQSATDGALPDSALHATGEQAPGSCAATIAVRDILRRHRDAIVFVAELSDRRSHRAAFDFIHFEGGQTNGAGLTVDSAICEHGIHYYSNQSFCRGPNRQHNLQTEHIDSPDGTVCAGDKRGKTCYQIRKAPGKTQSGRIGMWCQK